MTRLILLVPLVFLACGGESNSDNSNDASPDTSRIEDAYVPPSKSLGEACTADSECLGGLCVLNQYAPFRFCTRGCGDAQPGQFCPKELGSDDWTSLCVKYPDDFLGEPTAFCAPLCSDMGTCSTLDSRWESCEPPHWKQTPLYPANTDEVCMAASAQDSPPLDPDTCEGWEALFDPEDPRLEDCALYCEFLDACNHTDMQTSPGCCQYWCADSALGSDPESVEFFQNILCFSNSYGKFLGSVMECSKPEEECGEDPLLP